MEKKFYSKSENLTDTAIGKILKSITQKPNQAFEHLEPEAAYFYAKGLLSEARMQELDAHVPYCDECLEQFNDVADFIGDDILSAPTLQPTKIAASKQNWLADLISQVQAWVFQPLAVLAFLMIGAIIGLVIYRNWQNEPIAFVPSSPSISPSPAVDDAGGNGLQNGTNSGVGGSTSGGNVKVGGSTPDNSNLPPVKNNPADENKTAPNKNLRKEAPLVAENPNKTVPVFKGDSVEKLQPLEAEAGSDEPDVINVAPNATKKEFFVVTGNLEKGKKYSIDINGKPLAGDFKITERQINRVSRTGIIVSYNPQEIKGKLVLEIKNDKKETVRKYKISVNAADSPTDQP